MNLTLLNPFHYFKAAKQLLQFVLTPINVPLDVPPGQRVVFEKIKGTWTIFVVKMVLTIVISLAVNTIYDPVNTTTARHSDTFSPLMLVLVGVIVFPLVEEIAFRLSLRFKPLYFSLTSMVFAYYVTTKVMYQTNLSNITDNFLMRVSIALLIFLASSVICTAPRVRASLEKLWQDNFRWILYFFCLAFALVHLYNYESTTELWWLFPLITLPKLTGAFCYAYIRINYGFAYSLGLHLCWNAIGVIMTLIPAIGSD